MSVQGTYFARGSITVLPTYCLTGYDSAALLLLRFTKLAESKPVKQEVRRTVILPLAKSVINCG